MLWRTAFGPRVGCMPREPRAAGTSEIAKLIGSCRCGLRNRCSTRPRRTKILYKGSLSRDWVWLCFCCEKVTTKFLRQSKDARKLLDSEKVAATYCSD